MKGEAAELDRALADVPGVDATPQLTLSVDDPSLPGPDGDARRDGRPRGGLGGVRRPRPDAATLTNLLSRHDKQTADAAAQGSAAHYRQALDLLDESDAMIAQARGLRDDLAGYDRRLDPDDVDRPQRRLRRGRPPAVRRAAGVEGPRDGPGARGVRGEQAARRGLPADTRGLVVIMSDIAQGGLNQAVISIEQARGALASALDQQHQLQQPPEPPRLRRGRSLAVGSAAGTLPASLPASSGLPGAQQVRGRPPGRTFVQIRVVTDQPWEVSTDVLVVPVVGELEFTGAYDELDRRSGGELRRSRRSASCATVATGRRSARPASFRRGGCWSSRPATSRTSTARPCASSPPARSGA